MTVLAYRDGIMAADTAIWWGDLVAGHIHKARRMPDGSLVGFAGNVSLGLRFLDYFETGAPIEDFEVNDEEFGAIIVSPEGFVSLFDSNGLIANVAADWYAEGAGAEMAIGAMAAGADAARAVEICIANHQSVRGRVEVLELESAMEMLAC